VPRAAAAFLLEDGCFGLRYDRATVGISGRQFWASGWKYQVTGARGGHLRDWLAGLPNNPNRSLPELPIKLSLCRELPSVDGPVLTAMLRRTRSA
jgi:hypothetical protein